MRSLIIEEVRIHVNLDKYCNMELRLQTLALIHMRRQPSTLRVAYTSFPEPFLGRKTIVIYLELFGGTANAGPLIVAARKIIPWKLKRINSS